MSLLESLGQGLQGAGSILSPEVYQQDKIDQRNKLSDVMRTLQITQAQRSLQADRAFREAVKGVKPGMTSSAMMEALSNVDPSILSASQDAQGYLKMVGAAQQRESAAALEKSRLAEAWQRLNKPTEHFDSQTGKLIRSYPDGRMETLDVSPGTQIPKTRNRIQGTEEIQEEWDPQKRVWNPIGKGPRFASTAQTGASPLGEDPDFWYEYYDKTGKLPPMAWGAAGNPTREQFLRGFPDWKKKQGSGASDTAASQAKFKADASALTAVTKDLNTFEPYKRMLDKNADIAIELGNKVTQTNAALVNKPLNWLRQNSSSNPNVAEYLAQMRFVQIEAARVINNPRIVGQLTDEARKEIEGVINGNAPIAVVERVLNRLKTDGNNRFNAMRSQQKELISGMKGEKPKDAEEKNAAPQQETSPAQKKPEATKTINGKNYVKINGKWYEQ